MAKTPSGVSSPDRFVPSNEFQDYISSIGNHAIPYVNAKGQNPTPKEGLGPVQAKRNSAARQQNLLNMYEDSPKETREIGDAWYDKAHDVAHEVGKSSPFGTLGASANLAKMSAQKDWDLNVAGSRAVGEMHPDDARRLAETYHAVAQTRKQYGAASREHLYATQAHQAAREEILSKHRFVLPNGQQAGLSHFAGDQLVGAVEYQHGLANPHAWLDHPVSKKTPTFGRVINNPSLGEFSGHNPHPEEVVDTHLTNAATGYRGAYDNDTGVFSNQERFKTVADDVVAAARTAGTSVNAFHSTVWTHHRDLLNTLHPDVIEANRRMKRDTSDSTSRVASRVAAFRGE